MKSSEVRKKFLDYFAALGHRIVPSSSLIPHGDPTLLFTNAGMNQFKNVFLGQEKREYSRAVTCQKCVRAGGKHNDLENVGKTARHQTFFEMLGNFSFGDYFKKDATAWAWELVTKGFGMDRERLWISIHHTDDEAFSLWNRGVGVPAERIVRLGDKDNFWAMGETGPCGPCSEIYFDQGPTFGCQRPECNIECECGRYTEFWNLVFMQYNRNENGELIPLPKPSIDTGAGLERTTTLIQGVASNYETDLLFPLIQFSSEISGIAWKASEESDTAFRVLSDHARAATFLIAEGITPSNEGRGYVLRRIIRRALRYGRSLHFQEAFLYRITDRVVDLMKDAYPELMASREYVSNVCKEEEQKFKSVVESATTQLEDIFERATKEGRSRLLGTEIFKLYDTFGLPVDFVQEMANERNFEVDLAGFDAEMEKQRKTARAAWKGDVTFEAQEIYRNLGQLHQTQFTGYSAIQENDCEITEILAGNRLVSELAEGETGEIILRRTPFYAESGGQMGDRGHLISSSGQARVLDTQTPAPGLIIHQVQMEKGKFSKGEYVQALVDPVFRQSVRKNHTATHLLHAALRHQFGDHIKQAGSLVAPDRLRFDFTHYTGLKGDEVEGIENEVNARILSNLLVNTKTSTMDEAVAEGAMALFGEKYGDVVRVVTIGDYSKELCGGTHCTATGEVGAFLVSKESSAAAGIRRMEALTGNGALQHVRNERKLIENLSTLLKASSDEIEHRIVEMMDKNRKLEKEIERLKSKQMLGTADENPSIEHALPDGKPILIRLFREADPDQLGSFVDEMFQSRRYSIVAAGSLSHASLAIRVESGDDASEIFRKFYVPEFGGGGGGRKDFAKGGLKKLKDFPPEESLQKLLQATIAYKSR